MKRYIVTFKKEVDVDFIESFGGKIRYNYENFPEKVSILFPKEYVEYLLLNDNVIKITESKKTGKGTGIYADGWASNNWRLVETSSFHKQGYTGQNVKVAILDTGIGSHSLLPTIPSSRWKDFVNDQSSSYDDNWHGTFISGIVCRNAPGVVLYVGKILTQNCDGWTDDVIAGIDWAINKGVDIINFSVVTFGDDEDEYVAACRKAYNAGIVVVACTGNGTHQIDPWGWNWIGKNYVYPPANDYSTVGVGACDVDGNRAPYSNYGSGLDITAPGGLNTTDADRQLISTSPDNSYYYGYGTSFASAFVTAHCACLKSKYPSYNRASIVNKLLSTAVNGILKAEPLLHTVSDITFNSANIIIRYLSYPTSQYDNFRFKISGTTNWVTYSSGSSDFLDGYNGYDGQYHTSPILNFSNLQSNTTYTLEVEIKWNEIWYSRPNIIFVTSSSPRPTNWEWSTAERNAFNNHGKVSTITWDRWNLFIDKIIAFRNYKNLSTYVNIGGTSYAITNAKVSSNNKTLTALRFNIANQAITEMNSTSLEMRSTGDEVYGLMFLIFENKLNGIP